MRVLLEHGAHVNHQEMYCNKTAIHLCTSHGHFDGARRLLEHRADLIIQDSCLWAALHFSCHGHDLDFLQFLIEHEATLDSRDHSGLTPLHICVDSP